MQALTFGRALNPWYLCPCGAHYQSAVGTRKRKYCSPRCPKRHMNHHKPKPSLTLSKYPFFEDTYILTLRRSKH